MDVHKKEHRVAMMLPGGEIKEWKVANGQREVQRMIKSMRRQAPEKIVICYEAGPCGFGLQRQLSGEGIECYVAAPSLIPVKPGQRIKTDRRDAKKLAEYLKVGMLTFIEPPDEDAEAARDLTRLWNAAKVDQQRARQQLLKFLLRRGYAYKESDNWTKKHRQWLGGLRFEDTLTQQIYAEYLTQVEYHRQRVESLEKKLEQLAQEERYGEYVDRLRCCRGIDTLTAICLLTELYSFGRFPSARALMAYLGLTPGERSSGEKRSRAGITKAGNKRVRRLLIEAAWHQRHLPYNSATLRRRRKGQPEWVVAIARKAEKRLYQRTVHLKNNGKLSKTVNAAIAREMVGFIWDLLYEGPRDQQGQEDNCEPCRPVDEPKWEEEDSWPDREDLLAHRPGTTRRKRAGRFIDNTV